MQPRSENNRHHYPNAVPVLVGAVEVLVCQRHPQGKYVSTFEKPGYQTNNAIKYWSTWFLLKALTTSRVIQEWVKQKDYILPWLQMTENSFRSQLRQMKDLGLVQIDKKTRSIVLSSYETAATVLGINYCGTYKIEYHHEKFKGKQTFRFLLTAEEIRKNQDSQLSALIRNLDNNPQFRTNIIFLLEKEGFDKNRLLIDTQYLQQALLELQTRLFKDGSEILSYVFAFRADVNRGVKAIARSHRYRSPQSVSYLKKRMITAGVVSVRKICVHSALRSRVFIPGNGDASLKDGYKWIEKKKCTALFLCDQVTLLYKSYQNS